MQDKGKFEEEWKNVFEGAELTPSESIWNSISARLPQTGSLKTAFEKMWEKAFHGAELEPSGEVWKAIDVTLVQAENTNIKKRVVFYQRLAAASVGIMIMFGAYSWFSINNSTTDLISVVKSTVKEEPVSQPNNSRKEPAKSSVSSTQNSAADKTNGAAQTPDGAKNIENRSGASRTNDTQQVPRVSSVKSGANTQTPLIVAAEEEKTTDVAINTPSLTENGLTEVENGIANKKNRFVGGPVSKVETMALESLPDFFGPNDYSIAYRLADARPALLTKRKGEFNKEAQWASVGFSAGSFYPGIGGGEVTENLKSIRAAQTTNSFFDSKNQPTTTKEETIKSGTSMAVALFGGKRFLKKWIFQGGVSYMTQTSSTDSEVVSVAPANQVQDGKTGGYSLVSTNLVTYSTMQEINSNFQFVSVPLQLGYMVLDRKIGVQINGGFSPDFFLKNTVYNEATQVETLNSANDNGNLNNVSVSGIGGLEVSYRFLNHYRLSLVPGIKYSLTPVYSENSLASAKPFVADLGLRFRYIF